MGKKGYKMHALYMKYGPLFTLWVDLCCQKSQMCPFLDSEIFITKRLNKKFTFLSKDIYSKETVHCFWPVD